MIGNVWEWTASDFDASGRSGTIRGGSYLCSPDFCARFRPSARQPQERDFSASHIGFRTVVRETRPGGR
jgi:formylglycine-generating enzyme required for sulfatase activity